MAQNTLALLLVKIYFNKIPTIIQAGWMKDTSNKFSVFGGGDFIFCLTEVEVSAIIKYNKKSHPSPCGFSTGSIVKAYMYDQLYHGFEISSLDPFLFCHTCEYLRS